MSGALLDERCVIVQPSLVRGLGRMADAAVLQQIHYEGLGRRCGDDGFVWVIKPVPDLVEETGLTPAQVRRSLGRLEELGILMSCQPSATSWNRQKAYRVNLEHPLTRVKSNAQNCALDDAGMNPPMRRTAPSSTSEDEDLRERVGSAKADPPNQAPEVAVLCDLLADLIAANGSPRPSVTQRWRDAARLMLFKDERPADQIEMVIRWSQADDFWRSNILSMPKLREKYDTLRLQATRNGTVDPRANAAQPFGGIRGYGYHKGIQVDS